MEVEDNVGAVEHPLLDGLGTAGTALVLANVIRGSDHLSFLSWLTSSNLINLNVQISRFSFLALPSRLMLIVLCFLVVL